MDKWIVDQFDRAGIWAQKRGWLLTDIRMHVGGLTFAVTVSSTWVQKNYWLMPLVLAVWGGHFIWALNRARWYRDYPSNIKMMQRLNAEAVRERETGMVFRLMFIGLWVTLMPVNVYDALYKTSVAIEILDNLATFVPMCLLYVFTMIHLGPGEFAKQKQETTSGQEIFSPNT